MDRCISAAKQGLLVMQPMISFILWNLFVGKYTLEMIQFKVALMNSKDCGHVYTAKAAGISAVALIERVCVVILCIGNGWIPP